MCKNDQVSEEAVQYPQSVVSKVITNDVHRSRLVYNSRVKSKEIEALFAKRTGSTRLSTPCLPIVFGQVIRARVAKPQNNNKIVMSVANDQSVETNSDHGSSHDVGLNPSPHNSTTVAVVSSAETLTTSKTFPNWEGSYECVSRTSEFGTSQV